MTLEEVSHHQRAYDYLLLQFVLDVAKIFGEYQPTKQEGSQMKRQEGKLNTLQYAGKFELGNVPDQDGEKSYLSPLFEYFVVEQNTSNQSNFLIKLGKLILSIAVRISLISKPDPAQIANNESEIILTIKLKILFDQMNAIGEQSLLHHVDFLLNNEIFLYREFFNHILTAKIVQAAQFPLTPSP
ncbi:unnamed protein product [Paramecium octaurelia]|uniref:Uncharacterized protein n=1 Tax=Paramecium octaurelia TaxID=43137 RepID=A0A8S1YJ64_PAROT|nr:unnamed protein product [Paramecium octaurelia]